MVSLKEKLKVLKTANPKDKKIEARLRVGDVRFHVLRACWRRAAKSTVQE